MTKSEFLFVDDEGEIFERLLLHAPKKSNVLEA